MNLQAIVLTGMTCLVVILTILYTGTWLTIQIIRKQSQEQTRKINATLQRVQTMTARLGGCQTLEDIDKVLTDYNVVRMNRTPNKKDKKK